MGDVLGGIWLFTMFIYFGAVLAFAYEVFSQDSFFRALGLFLLSIATIPFAPILIGILMGE